MNFIEAKIPEDIFNTLGFDLNIKLAELHTIYHLQMLDNTMVTIWSICKCYKYFLISSVLNNIVRNLMTRCSCAI
jgi:hypothetical protein